MAAPSLPSGIPDNIVLSQEGDDKAPLPVGLTRFSDLNFSNQEKLNPGFVNAMKSRALQLRSAGNLMAGDYEDWYDQQRLANTYQTTQLQDIQNASDVLSFVRDTLGQSVVDVLGVGSIGAASTLATGSPLAGWLATAGTLGTTHAMDTYAQARDEGIDPTAFQLMATSVPQTALDLGFLGRVLNRTGLKQAFGKALGETAEEIKMQKRIDDLREGLRKDPFREVALDAAAEGTIEVAQELIDKTYLKLMKGEATTLNDQDWLDLMNAWAGGAVGGATIGGVATGAGKLTEERRAELLDQAERGLSDFQERMKKIRQDRSRVDAFTQGEEQTYNEESLSQNIRLQDAHIANLEKNLLAPKQYGQPVMVPVMENGQQVMDEAGNPKMELQYLPDTEREFWNDNPLHPDNPFTGDRMAHKTDAWSNPVAGEKWIARLLSSGKDENGASFTRAQLGSGTHVDYSALSTLQAELDAQVARANSAETVEEREAANQDLKRIRMDIRNTKSVLKFAEEAVNIFKDLTGVKTGFLITDTKNPNHMGSHFITVDGIHGLAVNLDHFKKSKVEAFRTIAHEFGHALVATKFVNERPEIQVALRKEYREYLNDLRGMPETEFYRKWRSALDVTPGDTKVEDTAYGKSSGYWMNFEEFMAERFARFALSSKRVKVEMMEKNPGLAAASRGVFADLKVMMDKYKKAFAVDTVFPTTDYSTWVELLVARSDRDKTAQLKKDVAGTPVKPKDVEIQVIDAEVATFKAMMPSRMRDLFRVETYVSNAGQKIMHVTPIDEKMSFLDTELPEVFYRVVETKDESQPYGKYWHIEVDAGSDKLNVRLLGKVNRVYTSIEKLQRDLEKLNRGIIQNYFRDNSDRRLKLRTMMDYLSQSYPDVQFVWRNFPVGKSVEQAIKGDVYQPKKEVAKKIKEENVKSLEIMAKYPSIGTLPYWGQDQEFGVQNGARDTYIWTGPKYRVAVTEKDGKIDTIHFAARVRVPSGGTPFTLRTFNSIEDFNAWLVSADKERIFSGLVDYHTGLPGAASRIVEATDPREPTAAPQKDEEDPGVSRMVMQLAKSGMPKESVAKLQETAGLSTKWWNLKKWLLTPRQIAEQYVVEPFNKYMQEVEMFHNTKMDIISKADGVAAEWAAMSKDKAQGLSKFLFAVSIWSDENGKRADWNQIVRWATGNELLLNEKITLDDAQLAMYQKVDESFREVLNSMEESLISEAARTFIKNPQAVGDFITAYKNAATREAKLQVIELYSGKSVLDFMIGTEKEHPLYTRLTEIQKDFNGLRERNYFPRSRFGQYVLEMKAKKDGTVFEGKTFDKEQTAARWQFESKKERDKAYAALQAEYGHNFQFRGDVLSETTYSFVGMPQTLIERMKTDEALELTKEQREALDKISIDLSPGRSFLRHLNKRKGIHGYSEDAMRTYASYMTHAANHLARIKHGQVMQSYIEETRVLANKMREREDLPAGDYDDSQITNLVNYGTDHFKYIMNPSNDWAKVRQWGFMWYLGFSVKSALVNLTQVPMVAYPYLAARYGDGRAVKAISKAYSDVVADLRGKQVVSEEEYTALTRGLKEGIIDQSMVTELAGLSEGNTLARMIPVEGTDRVLKNVNTWGGAMFRHGEKFNRKVVFLSSFRLAMEKHGDQEQAYKDAKAAVQDTMFEYSKWNRAKFMRGKASVIFLFWNYMQHMSYLATGGTGTPEARKTAMRVWGMLLVTAGFLGVPMGEELIDLMDFFGTKGKEALGMKNPRVELRESMREMLLELHLNPDLFLHGLGKYYGLGPLHFLNLIGMPVPNVDVSGSMSMGYPVPWMKDALVPGQKPETAVGNLMLNVSGPVGGIGYSLVKFAGSDDPNEWKRLELIMPTALKNLNKGIRQYAQGGESLPGGAEFMNYDVTTWDGRMKAVAQGLGFAPTELTKRYEKYGAMQESKIYWAGRRQMLLREYSFAKLENDREGIADAMSAIRRHNSYATGSLRALRITGDDMSRSLETSKQNRQNKESLTPNEKMFRAEAARIGKLYQE